jgi:serine/threonine protein phosphatase 1
MTRHLAIGDIHGCITALTTLVESVALKDDDTIVFLGDYVDRGPDARAVVDLIIELGRPWLSYGGEETLQSYGGSFDGVPDEHIEFLQNSLIAYYECDTHFFVHACAESHRPLDGQSDAALYWRKFGNPDLHCSGKIMVCGHTPQESGVPLDNGNAVCIDTLAYGGGWLSCLDVESGTVWQGNEAGEARTIEI